MIKTITLLLPLSRFLTGLKAPILSELNTVDYKLAFGILGNIAHRIFVRKKLTDIFNFRYAVLEKMFNSKK